MVKKAFKTLPKRPLKIDYPDKSVYIFFRRITYTQSGGRKYPAIRIPIYLLKALGWNCGDVINIAVTVDKYTGEYKVTLSRKEDGMEC